MRSREHRSDGDDETAGMSVRRRVFLGSLTTFGSAALAGCLGGTDAEDPTVSDEPTAGPGTETSASATPETESPASTTSDATSTESGPREIEDATGRTVSVPSTVEDVVAVGPGMLNLVAYLDATDTLVGVEEPEHSWARDIPYNIANPELQDLPVIGPHRGGDPELIADVDPDVVASFLATFVNGVQTRHVGVGHSLDESAEAVHTYIDETLRPDETGNRDDVPASVEHGGDGE